MPMDLEKIKKFIIDKGLKILNAELILRPAQNVEVNESDFMQLADFLFKPYSIKSRIELQNVVSDLVDGEITEEILDFIPKSNWDRYFSDLVNTESKQLNMAWEQLNDIKCIVANNKSMTFKQYDQGEELLKLLKSKIEEALDNINKINISEEDKETVSLNTIDLLQIAL